MIETVRHLEKYRKSKKSKVRWCTSTGLEFGEFFNNNQDQIRPKSGGVKRMDERRIY